MFSNEHEGQSDDAVAQKLLAGARYVALAVFGLLPVFFIPSAVTPLGYSKILVAVIGLFLGVVLFAFSTLRRGTVRLQYALPIFALWVIFGLSILSGLFSGDFLDSFWGTEVGAQSGIFIGLLALTATFWAFIAVRKEVVIWFYLLLAFSASLLAVYHLLRIAFGADFLSFGVFGSALVSSPFGEWNSLAVFFGLVVIFSLVALEQLRLSAVGRGLFAGVVAASLLMLAVINFTAVFMVLGLVSLVMIIYSLTRGKFYAAQAISVKTNVSTASVISSLATLLVSIILVIGGSAVGGVVSNITGISHIEVRPSLSATIGVAKEVYRDHALLGIGPNKFVDAWRMYRDPSINTTIFWNTNFESGYGYIPTVFVTTGVLGGLAWIAFFFLFLYFGIRTLLQSTHAEPMWYFIALSSFVASVYLWGMSFIYVPGPVLLLLAAVCTGIFFGARQVVSPAVEKTYRLMHNPRSAFATVTVTVLIVVASVGSTYYVGRHYAAIYIFRSSIQAFQNGEKEEAVLARVSQAFELSSDDLFAQQVATYQGAVAGNLLQNGTANEETQAAFQNALQNGLKAGQLAVSLDNTNPDTWGALGGLFAVVVPLNIENVYARGNEALTKAQELDPKNPSRLVALAQLELLHNDTVKAREYIMRAINLKSNYTDAIYVLSQIEISEGHVDAAIDTTRATALLDAENPVRFFQLGVLQLSANKPQDAVVSLERAVALSAEYSNARYFLAFAYDAVGKKADAEAQLKEVLARNPGNENVEGLLSRLSAGKPLAEAPAAAATSTPASPTNEPLKENSESSASNEPVTSGQAPDSPLLTPVNTDTEQPQGE